MAKEKKAPKITDIFFGPAMRAKITAINKDFAAKERAILSVEFTGQDKAHNELKKQYKEQLLEVFTKAPLKVEEYEIPAKKGHSGKKKSTTKENGDVKNLL